MLAQGRSAHSGSAPDKGLNALLALAAAAQAIAAQHDPHGPDHLTAVPTVVRSGDAFNVVPADGRLIADVRADRLDAFAARPERRSCRGRRRDAHRGPRARVARDGRARRRPRRCWRARASCSAGPVIAAQRGGASDASHFAATIPLTVDGLGPRGGAAHNPGEFVARLLAAHAARRSPWPSRSPLGSERPRTAESGKQTSL